jgi:patatin-like phospholipase/acyl hydrolase
MHSGGVRGIVILEVLRHIQHELGGRIKVQEFFDLIVGTRSVVLEITTLCNIIR